MKSEPADLSAGAILIVDDEPAILELVTRVCEASGYRCLQASNGAQALAIFQHSPEDIVALMTDVNMPGMDGFALIRAVRETAPGIKIIISSGSLGETQQPVVSEPGISAFLAKPYTVAQLIKCVRSVLGD